MIWIIVFIVLIPFLWFFFSLKVTSAFDFKQREEMEYIKCALCNCVDYIPEITAMPVRYGYQNKFFLVRCSNCGLVYLNPRPKDVAPYYPKNYGPYINKFNFFLRMYYTIFRNIKGKGRLLDVGCGNGTYLRFMKNKWECVGIDFNEEMVNYCNTIGLEVYKGSIGDVKFSTQFDLITFWASLEHLENPIKALEKAKQLLRKDGRVVIWLQNIDSVEAKIFREYWHHLEVPTHYYQFTPKTLTQALEKTGYKVEKIKYNLFSFGFLPSLEYYLKDRGIKISLSKVRILSFPFDIFCALIKKSGLITVYAKAN